MSTKLSKDDLYKERPWDQPNSLAFGPDSCTSRGGSDMCSTSGKSPGTGPIHPPSQ